MIKKKLTGIVESAVQKIFKSHGIDGLDSLQYTVETPPGNIRADFATNVALLLSSKLKASPLKIAEELAVELSANDFFESVKFAKPGFINFYLNKKVFYDELEKICGEGAGYGHGNDGAGSRVMIEFVSANPTGLLHVGHGRGAAIGDCLANIMKALGYDVCKEYYVNDVGRQVGLLAESLVQFRKKAKGESFQVPEGGYEGEYIEKTSAGMEVIGDFMDGKGAASMKDIERQGIAKILSDIKTDLSGFGLEFDNWFSESSLYETGAGGKNEVELAVDKLKEQKQVYEKDGALWFASTNFGDDKDRVVIRNDGTRTYLASDIAYHFDKFRRGFNTVINIWGADHHGYIDRVKGSVTALGYEADNLKILLYQLVNLMRDGVAVVMSKRKADYVTLKQVIDEVGSDACRFFFLMRNSNSALDFDLELAKKQSQENPVYYVQYAHARICSVFREADKAGLNSDKCDSVNAVNENCPWCDTSLLVEPEELNLIKKLILYPELLRYCCKTLEPHHLTAYLQELVGVFHGYYAKHRVLGEDKTLSKSRLMLLQALKTVIGNGLTMLGIKAPEKM